jgi:hypothetical protein
MDTTTQRRFSFAIPVVLALALIPAVVAEQPVEFNRDVRPILSNKCLACHGPDDLQRQAGLRLDEASIATAELESGSIAIVPGDPDASELIIRITHEDESQRMPPAEFGKSLTKAEIDLLRRWIDEGARYAIHWSYVKPARSTPPAAPEAWREWPRSAIDLFALHSMLSHGLQPSPEADRYTLARRVFLDLTGLPPTIEEVDSFVADVDPQAYEKLVDDLLHRSAFGEHWARMWLDLARYADSAGYADDPPRTIWAYRDWVIRALNENKPFDQFTIEQIAGDLLPNPSDDQLIATAFHRNTMTNNEGGTQDEEFRNAAVVDRVNTTLAVWMGTTIACAQCHYHIYDPISQEEYFQVFAFLNNTQDADRGDEAPVLPIFTDVQRRKQHQLRARNALWQAILGAPTNLLVQSQTLGAQLEATRHGTQQATTVPIVQELAGRRRETRLQYRGNYLDKGPVVEPGLPAAFDTPWGGAPVSRWLAANPGVDRVTLNRLSLAHWLVDKNNPLTARVIVNRYWEALFGRGLVVTSEEFGSQGEPPSHPELLDWLANDFMDSGWDMRALIRALVTSAVYRQSSRAAGEAAKADLDNQWLARGPRVRLSAEMVRDQALAVSGLLSKKMYGPPVRPPQPTLGLKAAFGSATDWETSGGEDRFRRGIYTTWRRSNPYPSMATFDAPNREICTVRRSRTNTPLQSLVTLNDPVFVEAAQALARRAIQHSNSVEDRISYAFRCCLSRPPRKAELQSLVRLYQDSHLRLVGKRDAALTLATEPLGELPPSIEVSDAAAMTVVGNVLLNLDEMVLKR